MTLEFPITPSDSLSLAEAAELLPKRRQKPLHVRTIRGWVVNGVAGKAGQPVRLKAYRVGRTWFTRVKWVREFMVACTDGVELIGGLPAHQRRSSGGMSHARRQLIAEGMYGPEKKNEVLGMQ